VCQVQLATAMSGFSVACASVGVDLGIASLHQSIELFVLLILACEISIGDLLRREPPSFPRTEHRVPDAASGTSKVDRFQQCGSVTNSHAR
jgi:hypothetical protein